MESSGSEVRAPRSEAWGVLQTLAAEETGAARYSDEETGPPARDPKKPPALRRQDTGHAGHEEPDK